MTRRLWAAGAVSQRGLEPLRCLRELKPQRHCRRGWNTWTWGHKYSLKAVWIARLNHRRQVRRNRDCIPQLNYLRFSISCFLSGDDGAADRIFSASCHFPLWQKQEEIIKFNCTVRRVHVHVSLFNKLVNYLKSNKVN